MLEEMRQKAIAPRLMMAVEFAIAGDEMNLGYPGLGFLPILIGLLKAQCKGIGVKGRIIIVSRVSKSTAVSGSHMPVASRPKRWRKSASPQATCVRLSRGEARGKMVW